MKTFAEYYATAMGMICLYVVVPAMVLAAGVHFRSGLLVAFGVMVMIAAAVRFAHIISQIQKESSWDAPQ